ncbi:glycosyltransferase family 4 protein [Leptothoe spongobia]|uniref:Glycosyltransferase family 4 protein n=1 Tax=Leptothoe spongobia TAU-MAC 1115 TaxID=1967444 RepID=A0A947DK10_9CYAN|nr:glycosyltransferase family 1 protein [Leptothoe spongobia]MBT9317286.1 glycosyltransferase family 4 protein [Leptothoe spongobia TAU-MAC 1115]
MRIAILRRAPQIAFSMDVYADELISGLRTVRPDWEILEISPRPWWSGHQSYWKSGIGIRKYYERFWNHPRDIVYHVKADVFHIIDHTDGHIGYWLKKSNKRFVVTCHDLVQFVYPEILNDQSRFPRLSMAAWKYSVGGMHEADSIIAVSNNTKNDIINNLNISPDKVGVIPNAVSSEFNPYSSCEKDNARTEHISSKDICLLNVGSTHQRKNVLAILQTIKKLLEKGIPVRLWRLGGRFTSSQKQFIEDNALKDFILDLGTPSRSELVDIYNAADMLLAPSLYEGFGLTVLEAMACGLPVITSNVSSLPEVCGEAAVLVDPLDVDQIVDAVINLKSDFHYYKSFVSKGIERSKSFNWLKTAEKVAQVYGSVLSK